MVKFWRMLIAMLAMMAMVVVPTSCGDDDDDNGTTSKNPIVGKCFYIEDGVYHNGKLDELIGNAINFNEDGSFAELWWYGDTHSFYYEEYKAGEKNGTYYVDDSNVILSYSDLSDTLKISQSGNNTVLIGMLEDVVAKEISYSEARAKYESYIKDHDMEPDGEGGYKKFIGSY